MITIYYHGKCTKFYGRAGPIVAALEFAGKVRGTDYQILAKEDAPDNKGFAVPIVTFDNGVTIGQTTAILEALGEDLGISGKNREELLYTKQYLQDLTDVLMDGFAGKMANAEGEISERGSKWFSLLETRLESGYFVGDAITVVDFYAYFVFLWLDSKKVNYEKYQNVNKWLATVNATKGVKELIEGPVPFLP